MSVRLAISACAALLSSACAPIAVTDPTEIETHRMFEIAPIRGADACVDEIWLELGEYAERAQLTLRVDHAGRAQVESAQIASLDQSPPQPSAACLQQLQATVTGWRYRPFSQYGLPSSARIAERVMLIPAERWRDPRRPFPEIDDIATVRITLKRREDLYPCREGRHATYDLELRGDGHFTLTELVAPHPNQRVIEGSIDTNAFAELVAQFRAADFFSLQERYVAGWTHQSSQTLIVEVGDQIALVEDYLGETTGMPLIVRALQNAVDRAVGLQPPICAPGDFLARMLEHSD